jgi:RDD family protein
LSHDITQTDATESCERKIRNKVEESVAIPIAWRRFFTPQWGAGDEAQGYHVSAEAEMPVLPAAPRYARFTRRVRGIVIDWIVAVTLVFGAVLVATSVRSDGFSRALGILVVMVLVLYEPVLVSRTGGTLGHYFSNLRVVDERNGGNVSFAKALARLALKSLLGWYSFIVMAATRRNQAVHDLLTRSTVQIRDPANARPHHYIIERKDLQNPNMPSRLRRATVICLYLLLAFFIYGLAFVAVVETGNLSEACLDNNFCSVGDRLFVSASALVWIAVGAACIGLGWRGSLPGARRARPA